MAKVFWTLYRSRIVRAFVALLALVFAEIARRWGTAEWIRNRPDY